MIKPEIRFSDEKQLAGSTAPISITGSPSFDFIRGYLSTKPLRRHSPNYGRPFTPEEHDRLVERAKNGPPLQAWLDEDFTDL